MYHATRIFCCDCLTGIGARCIHTICPGCLLTEFTDEDFPPNDRSIGKVEGDTASGVKYSGGAGWARAADIAMHAGKGKTTGVQLFEDKIEPADVLQGAL